MADLPYGRTVEFSFLEEGGLTRRKRHLGERADVMPGHL